MKREFLSGKWLLYTLLLSGLLLAASCANHATKESTQQKLEQEPKTVKKAAVVEEKQDTVMFQKKLEFFKKFDTNKDKQISEKEYLNMAGQKFDTLDANHDGKLTAAESDLVTPMLAQGKKYVTKAEFLAFYSKKFKTMDKNKDGYIDMEELDIREN